MKVENKVAGLRVITPDQFLSLEFNTLKDKKRDITKLANSIKKNGWSFPVFVWEHYVLDGAGRKLALQKLLEEGHEVPEIPVVDIQAKDIQEAKQKVLEVSSQYGMITKESFLEFSEDLELDFDTFEIAGIDADLLIEPEEKDDEVPEVPEEPQSKLGDLYELGQHRVLCGDSTKIEDVERLMDGKKADMVFTDPPYSVNYKVSFSKAERGKNMGAQESYQESDDPTGLLDGFIRAANADLLVMTYPVDRHLIHLASTFASNGYETVRELVWVKDAATFHPGQTYQQKHEPILVCKKKGVKYPDTVPSDANTVLMFDRPRAHQDHPTEKPQTLWQTLLKWHTKENDLVHEPFGGSGATMIACEKTGRKCNAMEIEPRFVDVIVQRYVDYTGIDKIKKNGEEVIWQKTVEKTKE